MKPTPILILSDSPETNTGLARISRELAVLLSRQPEFRVGFLGLRGTGSSRLPFPIYQVNEATGMFGESTLHIVWDDFAGREEGIIFTIWDVTRCAYLVMPGLLPQGAPVRDFLARRPFKLWGYFPVDAIGPNNRFPEFQSSAYRGWDRRLFYTQWARAYAEASLGVRDDWIPHGIDLEVWKPHDRLEMRSEELPQLGASVPDDALLVGCVASNQPRKDWGLVFQTMAHLRKAVGDTVYLWAHTDMGIRHWNLYALAQDFNLEKRLILTSPLPPKDLAKFYSACDVTIAPGLGEGFGLPIVESLACGTPVVHGDYGGGAELLPKDWLASPVAWRLDGIHNQLRPVFAAQDFTEKVLAVLREPRTRCQELVEHLDWKKLWPSVWKKWFCGGCDDRGH